MLEAFLLEKVIPSRVLPLESISFLRLCKVLSALSVVNSGVVHHKLLRTLISEHIQSQQCAYVLDAQLPKTHFALHLPDHLKDHGILLSTFLMERKHKTVKRLASDMYNLTSYEQGLMEAVSVQALYDLSSSRLDGGVDLVAPKVPSKRLLLALKDFVWIPDEEVHTSKGVCAHSRVIQIRDVVSFTANDEIQFGLVNFHARIGRQCLTCISVWPVLSRKSHCVVCSVERQPPVLVRSEELLEPCVYKKPEGARSIVLLPPKFRVAAQSK